MRKELWRLCVCVRAPKVLARITVASERASEQARALSLGGAVDAVEKQTSGQFASPST